MMNFISASWLFVCAAIIIGAAAYRSQHQPEKARQWILVAAGGGMLLAIGLYDFLDWLFIGSIHTDWLFWLFGLIVGLILVLGYALVTRRYRAV